MNRKKFNLKNLENMPINQLEGHPYLNYRDEFNIEKSKKIKGLIIGSFPIYACSNLLDNNLHIVNENNIENQINFRFFYGSINSKFWNYLFETFENENEITIANCIKMLEKNDLIITDVLSQTNRQNQSSADSDLMLIQNANDNIVQNLKLNNSIVQLLNNNLEIENLYFTAKGLVGKSPFGWFKNIFNNNIIIQDIYQVNGVIWSFNCLIEKRKFKVFMLPTPKPRGIHFADNQQNECFANYMQHINIDFYNQIINLPMQNRTQEQIAILSQLRHDFLIETYRQAFIANNMNFNGQINNQA